MIAVDSNILVHAHRRDSSWHGPAKQRLDTLAMGPAVWAIPWPCVHEFTNIVTHPKIYSPPSTIEQAVDQIDAWLESPSLVMVGESANYWSILRAELLRARVIGPKVHDARIAAICIDHGVVELWTADRDFSRFPVLRTLNPLVGSEP
jgi:toxin-antitoxin system PIN domain toxin